MSLRPTITSVLAELRVLCDLTNITEASADFGHFSDEELQTTLDKRGREEIRDWQLEPIRLRTGGVSATLTYSFPSPGFYFWPEVYTVVDNLGTEATGYTVDYATGLVTFETDQGGKAYFARGNGFWLDRTAAYIWRQKAGLRVSHIQFKAGDHTLYEQQEYDHCLAMAKMFGGNKVKFSLRRRVDYASGLNST